VAEVQYVDANGVVQSVSDPNELRAAAGCFGLLGPVTQLTLRVDRMYMAVMNPVKLRTALAIPPPEGYPVPKEVDMSGITPQMMQIARDDFVKRCENSYYLEWFWFAYQKEVWVNTWERMFEHIISNKGIHSYLFCVGPEVAITEKLEPYPSTFEAAMQWVRTFFFPPSFTYKTTPSFSLRTTWLKRSSTGVLGRRFQDTSKLTFSVLLQWSHCLTSQT